LVGYAHGIKLSRERDIAGTFNNQLENKVFVLLEECNLQGLDAFIKDASTSSTTIGEKKFVSSKMSLNYLNFCGTSNEVSPISDGRRVFLTEANPAIYDKNGNEKGQFFKELNYLLDDGDNAARLAKSLVELFIYFEINREQFEPRKWFVEKRYHETPETETKLINNITYTIPITNPTAHFWHTCLVKRMNVNIVTNKQTPKPLYQPTQGPITGPLDNYIVPLPTVDPSVPTWAIYVEVEDLLGQYQEMQRGRKRQLIMGDSIILMAREIFGFDAVRHVDYNGVQCISIPLYKDCLTAVVKYLGIKDRVWYCKKYNILML